MDIFIKGHRNLSVFYLTQNLFHQGKGQRDISLNSSYIIYFKNPRDKTQIRYLARQVSPDNPKFIEDAYRDATIEAHGYLMVDLKQSIKTNVFPFNGYYTVYVPTKEFKYIKNQTKFKLFLNDVALLKTCDEEEINCICECIHNVLKEKVPLKNQDNQKLNKHKNILRKLVQKCEHKLRKNIIIQ